jgi:hypothetical protein
MWRGEIHKHVILVILVVLVAACSGQGSTAGPDESQSGKPGSSSTVAGDDDGLVEGRSGECEIPPGSPLMGEMAVDVEEIGEIDGIEIRAAVYPHPDYEGNPWSQWGQGIVVEDGRFFSAIGDHQGPDGNSYVYEYDPSSGKLTMVGDILSYVDHVPGTWGHGKIHSQMVPGPCGEIYFSTYWGSFRDIEFEGNYRGELLFRLDPYGRTMQPLGVPIEFHGQASLGADPSSGLIYGEAIDPVPMNDEDEIGPFFAYDVRAEEVVFVGPDQPHVGFRSVMVDSDGVAYYSIGGAQLQKYDPQTGESTTHEYLLPGDWLRAVTRPAPDGSVYGVSREPDTFFVMHPDGSIDELGDAVEYTASMALSPDGTTFYYMPGAHGDSAEWGSPLIGVDTSTGEQSTVVELNALVEEELGYTVGGTYDVAVSPDGSTVFMGANVGEAGSEETFGEVVLLVIELP